MALRSLAPLSPFFALIVACGGSDGDAADPGPAPAPTEETSTTNGTGTVTPTPAAPAAPVDDPGPKPAGCGDLTKNKDGFFTRTTPKGSYVGYVPASYTGQPMRLVVGLHGCGDTASNFATWGISPYDTRKKQDWIGITVDGASGGGNCWDLKNDVEKVTAAIADMMVSGSNRLRSCGLDLSVIARLSETNRKSNFPFSANWAWCLKNLKSVLASVGRAGWRQSDQLVPTP